MHLFLTASWDFHSGPSLERPVQPSPISPEGACASQPARRARERASAGFHLQKSGIEPSAIPAMKTESTRTSRRPAIMQPGRGGHSPPRGVAPAGVPYTPILREASTRSLRGDLLQEGVQSSSRAQPRPTSAQRSPLWKLRLQRLREIRVLDAVKGECPHFAPTHLPHVGPNVNPPMKRSPSFSTTSFSRAMSVRTASRFQRKPA